VTRVIAPTASRFGRVNPLMPGIVALMGLAVYAVGHRAIGGGIAIGAGLALINGMILSKRVEFAATTGSVAQALMVMQIGLLVTFAIVGAATVVLIHFSLQLTVGCAVGFVVSQLAILFAFYWTHARSMPSIDASPTIERNPS
jgi:hypothetical protein